MAWVRAWLLCRLGLVQLYQGRLGPMQLRTHRNRMADRTHGLASHRKGSPAYPAPWGWHSSSAVQRSNNALTPPPLRIRAAIAHSPGEEGEERRPPGVEAFLSHCAAERSTLSAFLPRLTRSSSALEPATKFEVYITNELVQRRGR